MRIMRTVRRSAVLFGAGAATAYLFDPESGPERRERLKSKLDRSLETGNDTVTSPPTANPSATPRPAGQWSTATTRDETPSGPGESQEHSHPVGTA